MDGVWVQHVTARSQLCLIELRDTPLFLSHGAAGVCDGKQGRPLVPAPTLDCYCGVLHEYKTLHIDVNGDGMQLVSEGVLDLMRSAGETGFNVVGHTATPPPLQIGIPRPQVDFDNRKYRPLTPLKTA